MAKEIVRNIWCDACADRGDRTPGTEEQIGLAGRWLTLDLCENDRDTLLAPLRELLEAHGAPVDPPAAAKRGHAPRSTARHEQLLARHAETGQRYGRKPSDPDKQVRCFYCPLDYSIRGSASGLTRHLLGVHGYSGRAYVLGERCPICGKEGVQLLSAHVVQSHKEYGLTTGEAAVWWAAENGDPHGVYAEVLSREPDTDPDEGHRALRERERRYEPRLVVRQRQEEF